MVVLTSFTSPVVLLTADRRPREHLRCRLPSHVLRPSYLMLTLVPLTPDIRHLTPSAPLDKFRYI